MNDGNGCGAGCEGHEGHEGHECTDLDFVRYEIEMFRTAYQAWLQYSDDGFLNNSFLEVFLLHFRTLHDILHRDGPGAKDLLDVAGLFDSDESYQTFLAGRCKGEDLDYLKVQDGRAGLKLGRLTRTRIDDTAEWDIHKIHETMDKSVVAFLAGRPDACCDDETGECESDSE